jgi:hypothetical protein
VGDASLSGRHHSGSGCVSSQTKSEPFVQYSELFIQTCPYLPPYRSSWCCSVLERERERESVRERDRERERERECVCYGGEFGRGGVTLLGGVGGGRAEIER